MSKTKYEFKDQSNVKTVLNISKWDNVPNFAILTGKNGSGKSLGLDGIKDEYESRDNVIHIDSKDSYGFLMSRSSQSHTTGKPDITVDDVRKWWGNDNLPYPSNHVLSKTIYTLKKNHGSIIPSDDTVIQAIHKCIDYDDRSIFVRPIAFLANVFDRYSDRTSYLYKEYRDVKYISDLFEYHNSSTQNNININDFVSGIVQREGALRDIIGGYTRKKQGIAPWEQMNEILEKYKFKYSVHYSSSDNDRTMSGSVQLKRGEIAITHDKLSSGEAMMLSLMVWLFYVDGYDGQIENKIKLMLLDEPERHLDPKLIKTFMKVLQEEFINKKPIQIIMTTHRIDTIALAPEKSIFTIQECDNGSREIKECHPLLAMFRLTSNLREFTNHHHTVYTESRNDALFYYGIYKKLLDYSNVLREGNSRAGWQKLGDEHNSPNKFLISRRVQLSFMSVSTEGDAGGGLKSVVDFVKSDETAYHNLSRESDDNHKRFYDYPELRNSYGIIDFDYGNNGRHLPQFLEKKIITMNRHSVENYIFDPFIFSFSLLDNNNSISQKFSELLNTEMSWRQKLGSFLDNCAKISLWTSKCDRQQLQSHIDEYFKFIISKVPRYDSINEELNKNIPQWRLHRHGDVETDKVVDVIKNHIYYAIHDGLSCNVNKCFDELKNQNLLEKNNNAVFLNLWDTIKPERIVQSFHMDNPETLEKKEMDIIFGTNDNDVVKVMYPEIFLRLRGHDVAEGLLGEKIAKYITNSIAVLIYRSEIDNIPIPMDLANKIFELNNNARDHVRKVLKPDIPKKTWLEECISVSESMEISSSGSDILMNGVSDCIEANEFEQGY